MTEHAQRKSLVVASVGELVGDKPEDVSSWLEGLDIEELWLRRSLAIQLAAAAKEYKRLIDAQMFKELGEGNSVRLGDEIYTARPAREFKTDNGDQMMDWLGEDAKFAFNPNTVRITSLKHIAQGRGIDPQAVMDTFGHWEDKPDTIQAKPAMKAPKRLQGLQHLERDDG